MYTCPKQTDEKKKQININYYSNCFCCRFVTVLLLFFSCLRREFVVASTAMPFIRVVFVAFCYWCYSCTCRFKAATLCFFSCIAYVIRLVWVKLSFFKRFRVAHTLNNSILMSCLLFSYICFLFYRLCSFLYSLYSFLCSLYFFCAFSWLQMIP